ncbi:MAG: hypothetical protein Q8P95_02660 [bacterium]|nr:hypothetical protein [bacterium]
MKFLRSMIVVVLIASLIVSPVGVETGRAETDSGVVESFGEGFGTQFGDQLLEGVVRPVVPAACGLYSLGIDLLNLGGEGWSMLKSLLDMTVLFRNESWRNLLWGIEDKREQLMTQRTALEQQWCLKKLDISKGDQQQQAQTQEQALQLERRVNEVKTKMDFLEEQKFRMMGNKPVFKKKPEADFDDEGAFYDFLGQKLDTDKIFYWLVDPSDFFSINWEQVSKEGGTFLRRSATDFRVLLDALPDTCAAVIDVGVDLTQYFAYALEKEEMTLKEFLDQHGQRLAEMYGEHCQPQGGEVLEVPKPTSVEEQYRLFLETLNENIKAYGKALTKMEEVIADLDVQRLKGGLSSEDQIRLQEAIRGRNRILAAIDYESLALSKVGGPGSANLSKLGEKLSGLLEAVIGVKKDQDGKLQQRLSMAKRLEAGRERSYQSICQRIVTMYKKAGRSTSDLPVIGSANGVTYCRSEPKCEGVNLTNLSGLGGGVKELIKCSGFGFEGNELSLPGSEQDIVASGSEDLGTLLQEQSYNELLKAQNLHFKGLRARYKTMFTAQTDLVATELVNILKDVSDNLVEIPPAGGSKKSVITHQSRLEQIYGSLWDFQNAQKPTEACLAPRNPEN